MVGERDRAKIPIGIHLVVGFPFIMVCRIGVLVRRRRGWCDDAWRNALRHVGLGKRDEIANLGKTRLGGGIALGEGHSDFIGEGSQQSPGVMTFLDLRRGGVRHGG